MMRATTFGVLFVLCVVPACVVGGDEPVPRELATVEGALKGKAPSKSKSKVVLKAIDDICGATWGSGDYDFQFKSVTCSLPGSCTVKMIITAIYDTPTWSVWRSCRVNGLSDFNSLISTAPNGYQSLNQDYYMALTTCIGSIESKLKKPQSKDASSEPSPKIDAPVPAE